MRHRIAAFLAERGPTWGDEAAAALGLSLGTWWALVSQCRWFTFSAPGPAGWTLTELGRAEAAAKDAEADAAYTQFKKERGCDA